MELQLIVEIMESTLIRRSVGADALQMFCARLQINCSPILIDFCHDSINQRFFTVHFLPMFIFLMLLLIKLEMGFAELFLFVM